MKVSKTSWHYRLYVFAQMTWRWETYEGPFTFWQLLLRKESLDVSGRYAPKNLCRYFWAVVGHLTIGLVICLVFGVIIAILAPFVWVILTYIDSGFHEGRVKKAKEKKRAKLAAQEAAGEKEKTPGLLRSFLKARKQKVCPIIELVD